MVGVRNWTVAMVACLAVSRLAAAGMDDPDALQHWVQELSSSNAAARAAAAHGLALLGRDASGQAAALVPLLEDAVPIVRLEALAALIAIRARGDSVGAAAWRRIGDDPDAAVRGSARRLAKKLDVDGTATARELRRCLGSEHADAREAAVRRLGREGVAAAGDVNSLLVLVLDDEEDDVRTAASDALASLGSPLTQHQAALRGRLQAKDEAQRLRAARLLGRAAPLDQASLRALSEVLLTTKVARLRRTALKPLRDHDRANPALAARFLEELGRAEAEGREAAVLGLGALGSGSSTEVEALFVARLDPNGPRGAAFKALVRLSLERGALPHAAVSLASPNKDRRVAAAEVLAGVGEAARPETERLATLAVSDPAEEVRSASLKALASVATPADAKPVLQAALKDRSAGVRSTARVQLKALERAAERLARKKR